MNATSGQGRRRFLMQGTAVLGSGLLSACGGDSIDSSARFADGFVWGVATAAPQIESRDGRGPSIWDAFADTPGKVSDGSTNARNIEFDTRYPGDLALLGGAGLQAFRFSTAWPRIQPDASGKINEAGLALYDRMVDAMLANNLTPYLTLFHWDIPTWAGDFRDRDIAYRLADYADIVSRRLGDRVKNWMMLNEPNGVALAGYSAGMMPPYAASPAAMFAAVHHQNLAQALMFDAVRANVKGPAQIGTTISGRPVHGATNDPKDQAAAAQFDMIWHRVFLDPLYGKGYPAPLQQAFASLVKPGDMEKIAAKPDFLGVQYYNCFFVKDDGKGGFTMTASPAGEPQTQAYPVEPYGMSEMLLRVHRDYNAPDIYITETGFAIKDPAPVGGFVEDAPRIEYLKSYLNAAHDAYKQGVKLRGVFCWSAFDNWEWGSGFSKKFGLIDVNPVTQVRTPKRSLAYYSRCIASNAVA
ncbi:TPA: family 1 glycosylhydrolase [Burkholderia aenigmatica]|uniref:glycoside hydrolase family 1 protein n=1 Tax=Burkholderia sp. AU45251 TaxID=3059204 RepID=UPI002652A6FD|nr:family 1 glycosylhydrolase [Burkholderia sp. AU45251]HDR9488103.1 family 1 glycosylhydrolase [Burkholderia aenigmatica]MDN7520897.1 family 1 glycosylhydrolase [Burkholderia sp. AU45251]HDR9519866.1 family 1 glycosylhydrolase [Burkholderia aenigmatica]HDR9596896.1 family 1 glycosylhydrolase [Burkholderia aenigmatica]HDR9605117.1 family 1 glycosylhydrolase [Burkholderia aenigmatica]